MQRTYTFGGDGGDDTERWPSTEQDAAGAM